MKKNVLLAIPSFLDPEMFQQKGKVGPILQMICEHDFDEVILVGLQVWKMNAFLTEQAINANFPNIKVTRHILKVNNISSYNEVFYELKNILIHYEKKLCGICNEPVVLLPPSICDCLLDCWLLLTTSLHLNVRLCQVEPHYSSEGLYLQNTEDQNLDWLSENELEFREFEQQEHFCNNKYLLTPQQLSFLQTLCQNEKAFCLHNLKPEINFLIHKHFILNSRQNNQNFLYINCAEIPEEIMRDVLCGYKKSIEPKKIIERKGLFSKVKQGYILLSDFYKLPLDIQQNLQHIVQTEKELHVVGIGTSSLLNSVFPSFEFTA